MVNPPSSKAILHFNPRLHSRPSHIFFLELKLESLERCLQFAQFLLFLLQLGCEVVDEGVFGILSGAQTFGNGGYAVVVVTPLIYTNDGQTLLASVDLIALLSQVLGHLISIDVFLPTILTLLVHKRTYPLVLGLLLSKHFKSTSVEGLALDHSEGALLTVGEQISVVQDLVAAVDFEGADEGQLLQLFGDGTAGWHASRSGAAHGTGASLIDELVQAQSAEALVALVAEGGLDEH